MRVTHPAKEHYSDLLVRAMRGRAEVYTHIGNYTKGIEDFKKALAKCNEGVIVSKSFLTTLIVQYAAAIAHGQSNYIKAIGLIKQALHKKNKDYDDSVQAYAYDQLGYTHWLKGDNDQALRYHQKAYRIYRDLNDEEGLENVFNNLGAVYYNRGDYRAALSYYKKSLDIVVRLHSIIDVGVAVNNIGSIYYNQGKLDKALVHYRRFLKISEQVGYRMGINTASGNIGTVFHIKGALDQALAYYKKYYETAYQMGNKMIMGIACNNIGFVYRDKAALATALKFYNRAIILFKEVASHMIVGRLYNNIANIYLKKGELNKAMAYCKKAAKLATLLKDKRLAGIVHLNKARIYWDMKHYKRAQTKLLLAAEQLKDTDDELYLSELHSEVSIFSKHSGQYKKALRHAQKALFIAREAGMAEQEIIARRVMALILKVKDPRQAHDLCQNARVLAQKKGLNFELAISSFELSKIAKILDQRRHARRYLAEAESIFKNAGAVNWLLKCQKQRKNRGS
jgi:tetratricopeptide (TPR) repeat protein